MRSTIVSEFTKQHNFTIEKWLNDDKQGVEWLYETKLSLDEAYRAHAKLLFEAKEPTWAAFGTMCDRIFEHQSAAFVAFFTNNWPSMEIIARAVIEASVTVIFVAKENTTRRLGAYLAHYFYRSRQLLDLVKQSLETEQARKHIEFREKFMRQFANEAGIPFDRTGWPARIIDRFKAIESEATYRTLYAVLSGQAHNDAESLVDYIITKCLSTENPNADVIAGTELLYWARYYLYSGLEYYSIAAQSVASTFNWEDARREIYNVQLRVRKHLRLLSEEFRSFQAKAFTDWNR